MADASPVTSPRLIGSLRLRVGYGFSGRSLLVWQRGRHAGRGMVSLFGHRIGDTVGGMVRVGNNTFGYEDKRLSEERKEEKPRRGPQAHISGSRLFFPQIIE